MTRDERPYFFLTQQGCHISQADLRTREAAEDEARYLYLNGYGACQIEEWPAHEVEHAERKREYVRSMSMGG